MTDEHHHRRRRAARRDASSGDERREALLAQLHRCPGRRGRRHRTSSPATTCGSGCRTDAWRTAAEVARTPVGRPLLLLPVGHRLAAVALRPLPWTPRSTRVLADGGRPAAEARRTPTIEHGVAGGETRFQVFARVAHVGEPGTTGASPSRPTSPTTRRRSRRGPGSTPEPTGTSARRGRCSASRSSATPACATSTCPATSRASRCARTSRCSPGMVKPWPGIVDVEPMPGRRRARRADGRRRRAQPGRSRARAEAHVMTADHRSPEAPVHRRPGRRRAGQRRARDRGHDPQPRPAAPGHPRHAAHRRPPRRRAGHPGRADAWATCTAATRSSTEVRTYAADHHAGEPHRLARQLRQRGAVHPRGRAADGRRGAAAGAPGSARSSSRCRASRTSILFLGDMGVQLGADHARLLRLPRPRVRPQPDRGGHRWPLPPELRPHRRPQGRPARRAGSPRPRA